MKTEVGGFQGLAEDARDVKEQVVYMKTQGEAFPGLVKDVRDVRDHVAQMKTEVGGFQGLADDARDVKGQVAHVKTQGEGSPGLVKDVRDGTSLTSPGKLSPCVFTWATCPLTSLTYLTSPGKQSVSVFMCQGPGRPDEDGDGGLPGTDGEALGTRGAARPGGQSSRSK